MDTAVVLPAALFRQVVPTRYQENVSVREGERGVVGCERAEKGTGIWKLAGESPVGKQKNVTPTTCCILRFTVTWQRRNATAHSSQSEQRGKARDGLYQRHRGEGVTQAVEEGANKVAMQVSWFIPTS